MNPATVETETIEARPSRLVAEALVWRHDAGQIKERAAQMGLSDDLTHAVVCACCGDQQEDAPVQMESIP